jgi:hypothetical protein
LAARTSFRIDGAADHQLSWSGRLNLAHRVISLLRSNRVALGARRTSTSVRQATEFMSTRPSTLRIIKRMFPNLRETRLRNSAEFYSLFLLVWEMNKEKFVLTDRKRNAIAFSMLRVIIADGKRDDAGRRQHQPEPNDRLTGKSTRLAAYPCPVPSAKIFPFQLGPNQQYIHGRPVPRGAFRDRHGCGAGCGGRWRR